MYGDMEMCLFMSRGIIYTVCIYESALKCNYVLEVNTCITKSWFLALWMNAPIDSELG